MMVSVIIPNYNASRFLGETIESVRNQTFTDWEAIVVDDCSTDHSVEIIQSYANNDGRIRLIECAANNGGPAVPRNMGIAAAQGDYIAFLDSDDLWLPGKLEIQLRFMKERNARLSSTSYSLIDENSHDLNRIIRAEPQMNYKKYLRNTAIGFSTTIVHRELLSGISFQKMPVAEDFPFWLDVFRQGETMYGLQQVLTKYRVQKKSLSSNKIRSASQIWSIYREYERFCFLRAAFYFSCYAANAIRKRL
jgi:teichuronic acid biosynthesis glycosyltransferase TuaG